MMARGLLKLSHSVISVSRVIGASAGRGRVMGIGNSAPDSSRIFSKTLSSSLWPINRSNGENAPVANSSRYHIALYGKWTKGSRLERALISSIDSLGTTRSIRFEAGKKSIFLIICAAA